MPIMSEQAASQSGRSELPSEADLTFENIWQRWGDRLGFDEDGFGELWQFSAAWHGDAPGHNFTHAKEVLWVCMELADMCEAADRPVERKVLTGESLLHDAAAHRPLAGSGFSSSEERSGYIFRKNACRLGFTELEAERGRRGIWSTHPGVTPRLSHELVLRRGDLHNVSCDYDTVFRPRAEDFEQEARLREGDDFSAERFPVDSINRLLLLTGTDLILCPEDDQDWHKWVDGNLRRWAQEIAESRRISLEAYLEGLGTLALERLSDPVETVQPST